jgi:hypothetical protein
MSDRSLTAPTRTIESARVVISAAAVPRIGELSDQAPRKRVMR